MSFWFKPEIFITLDSMSGWLFLLLSLEEYSQFIITYQIIFYNLSSIFYYYPVIYSLFFGEVWYSFTVTSGTTYRVWWNDGYQDSGSKTLDIRASAFYSNAFIVLSILAHNDMGKMSIMLRLAVVLMTSCVGKDVRENPCTTTLQNAAYVRHTPREHRRLSLPSLDY